MSNSSLRLNALLGFAILLAILASAAAHAETVASTAYPLDTCVVSGEKLGSMGEPLIMQYKGREVRLCCSGCKAKFDAKPEEYLKKIDAAIIAQQAPAYPLDTCPVMGKKMGAKPIERVVNNRLVRVCCNECVRMINKDPAKYMTKLDEAIVAKQKPGYPLDTCVVSGKKLDGNAVDYIYAGRLVRLCCKDCIAAFEKEPAKYLAKITETTPKP